jgi:hypothetical protein
VLGVGALVFEVVPTNGDIPQDDDFDLLALSRSSATAFGGICGSTNGVGS